MRKEHLIALILGFGILAIAAGLYLIQPADETLQKEVDSLVIEAPTEPETSIKAPEEDQDLQLHNDEVTRIIIDDQDNGAGDISNILSEKVLINDEVVDQSELDELDQ